MKYLLIFLLLLVLLLTFITLGTHNEQVFTFNYFLAKGEYRISTLFATLFAVGFVLGWVICSLFYLRLRILLSFARRKIKRLEKQQILTESKIYAASSSSFH
ncbi:MAG: LapA family protein [Candidatus Malihini olakiniferum]